MPHRLFFTVLAAVLGFFMCSAECADAHTRLADSVVEWRHERLSVSAAGVPLADVLGVIAGKTGLEIHGMELINGDVHADFADVSLHEALTTLLQGANYCLQDPAGQKDAHYVLSVLSYVARPATGSQAAKAAAGGALTQAIKVPATAGYVPEPYRELYGFATKGDSKALRQAIRTGDTAAQAIAMQLLAKLDADEAVGAAAEAAKNPDPVRRLSAIQALAELDNKRATEALGEALADPDVSIRQAAVSGLHGQTSPDALTLLAEAMRDKNESIRALALDFLAEKGADGVASIRTALENEDPRLRERAGELLKQLSADP